MTVNIGKDDLRSMKTEKALNIAMSSLLKSRNFGKITVSDICEEALISRATFYAHYIDKYDLLKDWLICLKPYKICKDTPFELAEKTINEFVHNNQAIIKNLLSNANDETLGVLFDSILAIFDFNVEKRINGKANPKYVVLSSFYVGGMLHYLMWHVENKFPSDAVPMNKYLYEVMEWFQEYTSLSTS